MLAGRVPQAEPGLLAGQVQCPVVTLRRQGWLLESAHPGHAVLHASGHRGGVALRA